MGTSDDGFIGFQGAPLFPVLPPGGETDAADGGTGIDESAEGNPLEEELACNGGA